MADSPQHDGLVIVDKPAGITSHTVVSRVRRLAGTRKVGHAGTLDPMATGVLILGINRATRLLTYLVGADKEYTATIRLGATTMTDDAEGEVLKIVDASAVSAEAVAAGIARLTGDIQQIPSTVSAIKVDGQRAYARARAGEEVSLKARPVTISQFELLGSRAAEGFRDLDVRVVCSSGTYIRALARDLGADLGVGGHLTALRRTRVGSFALEQASTLEDLGEQFRFLPMGEVARAMFPVRELSPEEAHDLGFGRPLQPTGSDALTAAMTDDGRLLALLQDGTFHGQLRARPQIVFAG